MEKIIDIYLDYVNKFITVEKFCEWYWLDEEDALIIINMGEKYNDRKAHLSI